MHSEGSPHIFDVARILQLQGDATFATQNLGILDHNSLRIGLDIWTYLDGSSFGLEFHSIHQQALKCLGIWTAIIPLSHKESERLVKMSSAGGV